MYGTLSAIPCIIGRVAPLWGAEFSSLEQLHESTMTINSNEVRKLLSIYI
ncbi:hypothetical protein M088_1444 [Bacteroides ovatus str. 3725 D1 iv]|nr:hypothetical protein M088_1444 [Bacteroides ovatus str. 3725 D1 iv]